VYGSNKHFMISLLFIQSL